MDTIPSRKLSKSGATKILNVALARADELKCAVSGAGHNDVEIGKHAAAALEN